jgi:ribosome recycling factor
MEPITLVLPHPRSAARSTSQSTPRTTPTSRTLSLTVSLTAGSEAPLRALAEAPDAARIVCHPYDQAIVAHLLAHVGRTDCSLHPTDAAAHGELSIRVRLAVAS